MKFFRLTMFENFIKNFSLKLCLFIDTAHLAGLVQENITLVGVRPAGSTM